MRWPATLKPLVDKNANTLQVHLAPDLGTMHADLTKVRQSLLTSSVMPASSRKRDDNFGRRSHIQRRARWMSSAFWIQHWHDSRAARQTLPTFVQADASPPGNTGHRFRHDYHPTFYQDDGWEMSVASEPGAGTTFTVLLPLRSRSAASRGPQPEAAGPYSCRG